MSIHIFNRSARHFSLNEEVNAADVEAPPKSFFVVDNNFLSSAKRIIRSNKGIDLTQLTINEVALLMEYQNEKEFEKNEIRLINTDELRCEVGRALKMVLKSGGYLSMASSLLESSKTENLEKLKNEMSADFNSEKIKENIRLFHNTIFYMKDPVFNTDNVIGYNLKSTTSQSFQANDFIDSFKGSIHENVMTTTYSCVLKLTILCHEFGDEKTHNALRYPSNVLREFIDWMLKEFNSICMLELVLALRILGKSAIPLKASVFKTGDLRLIRNGAWDLVQFNLFKLNAHIDPNVSHFFITSDEKLSDLLSQYYNASRSPNCSDFMKCFDKECFGDKNSKDHEKKKIEEQISNLYKKRESKTDDLIEGSWQESLTRVSNLEKELSDLVQKT